MAPTLQLRQSQSLVMTPQLQQAIRLLALSNLEIEAVVAEEIEKNPLLTSGDEREGVIATPPAPDAEAPADTPAPGAADAPLDHDAGASFQDCVSDSPGGGGSGDDIDFDSFAGAAPTLADHLMAQLGVTLSAADLAIARVIVDALDDAGYLTEDLRVIAERLGVPPSVAERVLHAVQACEPTGVGARGLAECLRLQAIEVDRHDPCMATLIDHLDLLGQGRIAQLQRMCGVDDEDMADMIRELRRYDPKPGCRWGGSRIDAVAPDVVVTRSATGWHVDIAGGAQPRVLIDRRYHAELAHGARDKAAKAWLGETLASATWLVRALDQRQRTIVTVATEIVRAQEAFFERGALHLRPLTLRTVADAVGLHESTVSRVTSNKYLQCARGLFELKYFFASGVASVGATAAGAAEGGASATAVKAAIATLIAGEAADAILSDDTLVELLREQGFDLARRTVAKYREAIGLGSSIQRRRARAIATKAA